MELEEGNDRTCGSCKFWALLWDGCWDSQRWLGYCRYKREDWRRGFVRGHGYEPTPLDFDDFLYEALEDTYATRAACREWEEAE